jgi:uncharacterized protein (DUF3084 family)
MSDNFNLQKFLKKNTLLTENKNIPSSSQLKEDILRKHLREEIQSIMREESDLYEAEEDTEELDNELDNILDDEESIDGEVNPDVSELQDLLTQAQAKAEAIGDKKLIDQIGNTITFFTRAHVVKSDGTR